MPAQGNVFLCQRQCLPVPEGMSSCTRGNSSASVSFKCSLTLLESSNSASFARHDVDEHVHHRIRSHSQYRHRGRGERQREILWSLFHRQTGLVFSCFCPFYLEQSFICHLLVWLSASRPIRPSEEDGDDLLSSKVADISFPNSPETGTG